MPYAVVVHSPTPSIVSIAAFWYGLSGMSLQHAQGGAHKKYVALVAYLFPYRPYHPELLVNP